MAVETYQYALKTQPRHERAFARWCGCRRWVWNHLLIQVLFPIAAVRAAEKEQTGKATTRYPGAHAMQALLPDLKKEYPWLSFAPAHALQQAVVDLSAALLRVKDGAGFPRLKRKGQGSDSFREQDPACFKLDPHNSRIYLPKLRWVRYHNSRPVQGTPKTLTIVRKGKRWVASVQVETPTPAEPPVHPHPQSVVGIDRGVAVFAAMSDGTSIAPVSPLKAAARALRVAQRALARKKRGSHNRRKAAQKVRRIYEKVASIRKDFLHKTSTSIAKNHGIVVLEQLEVKNMTASAAGTVEAPGKNVRAKAGLNRAILDQGWFTFQQMLDYKLKKRGGRLVLVPAAYTSQRCSRCEHTAAENRRSQTSFVCVSCGHAENADLNAAMNIARAGQAQRGAAAGKPVAEHQPHKRRAHKPARRSA